MRARKARLKQDGHRDAENHYIISATQAEDNIVRTTHTLHPHTFRVPTSCESCGTMLWGITSQGMICHVCKQVFCYDCARTADADCRGAPREAGTLVRAGSKP